MKKVTIEIKKADLIIGVPRDHASCAIALAATRAGLAGVSVGSAIRGYKGDHKVRAALPPKAKRFMERFDKTTTKKERMALRPFKFTVNLRKVW
jgi:hypothetical protein